MAKLTSPTGSLMNNIYANSQYPAPVVGMGATRLSWTDRHPYTIIAVYSPKRINVQRDIAIRVDQNGMSECQEYSYSADPLGSIEVVTLRSNGRWVVQGEGARNGTAFAIGDRQKYHDYSL